MPRSCGGSELVKLLLRNDLVDKIWLKIRPLILGKGKKFFNNSAIPASFELTENLGITGGVIIAKYKKPGKVKFGTFGDY